MRYGFGKHTRHLEGTHGLTWSRTPAGPCKAVGGAPELGERGKDERGGGESRQEIAEKIAEGKMRKFFEEVTLLGQKYVRDESMQVRDILPKGVTVTSFIRMRVGEAGE